MDACQGSDADVIIVSTVRSCGGHPKLSGFLLDCRRVNVALSRAREECIIVGDHRIFRDRGGEMWRSVVDHYAPSSEAMSRESYVGGLLSASRLRALNNKRDQC